jgi:hypothetical protein
VIDLLISHNILLEKTLLNLPNNLKEKVITELSTSKVLETSKLDKKTQKDVLKNPEKYFKDGSKKLKRVVH